MLDKDTIKRILHLHQVQGLKAGAIAERFGFSSSRVHNVIRRKLQAASPKNSYKNFFWPTIPSRKQQASSDKRQAASSKRHKKATIE